jgi:hypothetical protein
MRLRLRRLRSDKCYKKWLEIEMEHFMTHSDHILSNITVQNQLKMIFSTCVYTLVPFKIFALLYSRVGAGAASKYLPGAA